MRNTLSIIVPAYNEAELIEISLREFVEAGKVLTDGYEIIVVNDGSADQTQAIAERFARSHPQVRIIQHERNRGIGAAYRTGLDAARMNYCMLLCADNTIGAESLGGIMAKIGEADLILPYIANPSSRPMSRRMVSYTYVTFLNIVFGHRLKYYNGLHILPTAVVQKMEITPSFAFSAQMVVRLLNAGYTYVDAPMENRQRTNGTTKAFRPGNVISVVKTILSLVFEIYFKPPRVQKPERTSPEPSRLTRREPCSPKETFSITHPDPAPTQPTRREAFSSVPRP